MDRHERLSACKWTTEAMIAAQDMMERAENRRDQKIGEAIFHLAYSLELILKDPRYSGGGSGGGQCPPLRGDGCLRETDPSTALAGGPPPLGRGGYDGKEDGK